MPFLFGWFAVFSGPQEELFALDPWPHFFQQASSADLMVCVPVGDEGAPLGWIPSTRSLRAGLSGRRTDPLISIQLRMLKCFHSSVFCCCSEGPV